MVKNVAKILIGGVIGCFEGIAAGKTVGMLIQHSGSGVIKIPITIAGLVLTYVAGECTSEIVDKVVDKVDSKIKAIKNQPDEVSD